MGSAWKSLEKQVAKKLGGFRRIRISYSESCEDVYHPTLSIECKYGGQIPRYCIVQGPSFDGEYVYIPSSFWRWGIQPKRLKMRMVRSTKFIVDGLAQACGYDKERKKLPMLCVKSKGMRGFIILMRYSDYLRGDVLI